MKIINVRKFDNYCNAVMTLATRNAIDAKQDKLYLINILKALLENRDIADDFENVTEIEVAELNNKYTDLLKSGAYGKDDEGTKDVTFDSNFIINYFSIEVKEFIDNVILLVGEGTVTTYNMYFEIVKMYDTTITELVKEINPNMDVAELFVEEEEDLTLLSSVSVNLNKLAKQNKLDPIDAREDDIDEIIEVLGRRQKSNPCLIGEAGVGKTAIIEGLADRINKGQVPDYLKGHKILSIDSSAIVGGTKFRGDFEERFNGIIYEASAAGNIILFFDEIHTLMSAGSSMEGGNTAANMLKPALARGDIRIIGATTTKEWKKHIEGDTAFERRLQSVLVKEPSIENSIKMLERVAPVYGKYHGIDINKDVIEASVKLSDRYITNKQLPDKAVTILDETCARIKAKSTDEGVSERKLSKENRLDKKVNKSITVQDIKYTVSKITGIDVNDLDEASIDKLKTLEGKLAEKVIGQDNAVKAVSKAIRRSKSGVKDPNKPIGTFLFVGPTGVGKTELAKQLTAQLSGDLKNLIRFDMSEYMEKHAVSKLIGSPPGYVGFGDGGQLTEAVKRNPYSIILLDEIEKAHPDIFNVFLQVLDDGILKDSQGDLIDFKNTVIIMTSNAGYGQEEKKAAIGFNSTVEDKESYDTTEQNAKRALEKTFRPEFLNRIDKIVVFNSLGEEQSIKIVNLMLNEIKPRLTEKGISLEFTPKVVKHIASEGFDKKYGARNLRRYIQDNVEDKIADLIIDSPIEYGSIIKLDNTKRDGIRLTVMETVKVIETVI